MTDEGASGPWAHLPVIGAKHPVLAQYLAIQNNSKPNPQRLIVLAGLAAWRLNLHEATLSQALRAVVLVLVNLLLAWLLLGVYVARRIAIPAVVIGGISASEGFRVGWRLYTRAGGHLVVAGLEALLGRVVVLVVLAVGVYALAAAGGTPSQPELAAGAALGAGVSVFVLVLVVLEWESRVWLRQYRRWVASFGTEAQQT